METDRRLRVFLESPRVSAQRKNEIIQKAYGGALPRNFVRFLQALVNHRRQMLIPAHRPRSTTTSWIRSKDGCTRR